ncbi:unnamed protein product [Mycena citricolor]|uniref:Peroxisomal ATPase PEX6 n=1 Tax=Mycena citricolor TaxID=2018698 RepID=A0AAD2JVG3_9AGAR|nr:unnamed protein product [Mycena citricolor]
MGPPDTVLEVESDAKAGTPIVLTEVVLAALSTEAYESSLRLDDWLYNDALILHQGDVCCLLSQGPGKGSGSEGHNDLKYRVDMLEPVMQGRVMRGATKVILTLDRPQETESDAESLQELLEIDESFLAPALSESIQSIPDDTGSKIITFECRPLNRPHFKGDYEDCTVYVHAADLGRLGGLDGDWVIARASSGQRLARVIARDLTSTSRSYGSQAYDVVFFVIASIEHDVKDGNPETNGNDVYVDSTRGELGFWLDPSVTRLIQAGVQHSAVPRIGNYFLTDKKSPRALFSVLNGLPDTRLLQQSSAYANLLSVCSASMHVSAADLRLDLSLLLQGSRGTGKFTTACWVAETLGMHLLEVDCFDLLGETDIKTEGTLRARFDKAEECSPCVLLLRHLEALCSDPNKDSPIFAALRDCIQTVQKCWKPSGHPVLVFGTISALDQVPVAMLSCFKHRVIFPAPSEAERYDILRTLLAEHTLAPDASIEKVATETAALVARDLDALVRRAGALAVQRASRITDRSEEDVMEAGVAITANDFSKALDRARAAYSESIGAPKIPNVSWDDIGGLASVKSDILDTIQLPLDHPELFGDGLKKRSGILLYGPPGTGKTMLAKAVATSCSLNFFSVKGPELLNMYIGESEANVRRVFQRARDAKPCVIFFDELDSVAPKRGNHGDSGGVMDRIVSQLLAELDGMSAGGSADVFVVGATNRPDLLDPALLRPGRFDRLLYLGVSDTDAAQLNILEALTRKFKLDASLSLAEIARRCPFNYTGADFYALCSDAMLNAMTRTASGIEMKLDHLNAHGGLDDHPHPLTTQYYLAELASSEDIHVLVSQADFEQALDKLVPSVSQSEMEHYAQVQQRFSQDVSM